MREEMAVRKIKELRERGIFKGRIERERKGSVKGESREGKGLMQKLTKRWMERIMGELRGNNEGL